MINPEYFLKILIFILPKSHSCLVLSAMLLMPDKNKSHVVDIGTTQEPCSCQGSWCQKGDLTNFFTISDCCKTKIFTQFFSHYPFPLLKCDQDFNAC